MAGHPPDRRQVPTKRLVARLLRAQHDVCHRRQLLERGMSPSAVDRAVASGALVVLYRGVYHDGAHPLRPEGRLLAACLAARGVASHRAAAWPWGMVEQPHCEVTVPVNRSASMGSTCAVHRTVALPSPSTRRAIPTTNPLRTMVDLGAVLPPRALWLAFARGLSLRLLTPEGVRAENDRLRASGRAGSLHVDALVASLGPVSLRSPSVLQMAFAKLVVDHGLESPDPEVEVLGGHFRLDFAYIDVLLAIELHGFDAHGDPGAASRGHTRARALTAAGWTVLVFTWEDVWRHPERVADELRGHLQRLRRRCA